MFTPQAAQAAVGSLKMCFKRLRIKSDDTNTASPSTDASNQDFLVGEVLISNTGALLDMFSVSQGNYRRIELNLF